MRFQGESLIWPMPSLLQGAFLGLFIVIPLAFLVEIATSMGRTRRGDIRRPVKYLAVLALGFVMAVGGKNAALDATHEHGSAESSERGLIYPELVAQAAALGHDIPRMLRFTADDIAYEPYDGALRGSRGTLLAGAGNSVDKALLLRDLLRVSEPNMELRFALGTLTNREAEELATSRYTRAAGSGRVGGRVPHKAVAEGPHAGKTSTSGKSALASELRSRWVAFVE